LIRAGDILSEVPARDFQTRVARLTWIWRQQGYNPARMPLAPGTKLGPYEIQTSRRPQATMYFNAALPFAANDLDLLPGGRTVALVAYSDQVNKYMIWTYDVPMSIILNWTSKMER
jgi:hypothetical protein